MSTPAEKANLARIRDNQRRSRARRREYLHELEQRIRDYDSQGVEASSEVQQAARRVAEENRLLRRLLNQHGITDNDISSYLHTGGAAAQADPAPIPHFPSIKPSDAVQSLHQVIAPRRPDLLEPGVSYVVPPQESHEMPSTSASMTLQKAFQPSPGSNQPLPRHLFPLTQSVPSHIPRQEHFYPATLVTQAPLIGAHDSPSASACLSDHSGLPSSEFGEFPMKLWPYSTGLC